MTKTKIILSSVIAVALLAGGVYAYSLRQDNQTDEATTSEESSPNDGKSSATGKESVDKFKESLADDSKNQPSNENDQAETIKPLITSYGQYEGNVEVVARVPGVFENSGKCTLTLRKGGKSVSETKNASPNVSEMSCGVIKISKSKLSSGSWSAVVSYKSTTVSGSSDTRTIEIK